MNFSIKPLSQEVFDYLIESQRNDFDQVYDLKNKDRLQEKIDFIKKEFFHQNLDSISIDSDGLDANSPLSSVYSMLNALREFKRLYPSDPSVAPLIKQIEEAYDFALADHLIFEGKFMDYDMKMYEENLKMKVQGRLNALKPGEKYILPGGRIGHAMLYQFSCRLDSKGKKVFDFKIYNGGEGVVAFHKSKDYFPLINPWARYQTLTIEGIAADEIFKSQFVGKLLDHRSGGLWVRKYYIPILSDFVDLFVGLYWISSIYALAKMHLIKKGGGTAVCAQDHKPHNYGTCTWKVLSYWAHENMPEYNYRLFKISQTASSIAKLQQALEVEKKLEVMSFKKIVIAKVKCLFNILFWRHSAESMLELGNKVLEKRMHKAMKSAISPNQIDI